MTASSPSEAATHALWAVTSAASPDGRAGFNIHSKIRKNPNSVFCMFLVNVHWMSIVVLLPATMKNFVFLTYLLNLNQYLKLIHQQQVLIYLNVLILLIILL